MKASNGDGHLGGDDFDQKIIDWMANEFKKSDAIDLRKDPMALQRYKGGCRNSQKRIIYIKTN